MKFFRLFYLALLFPTISTTAYAQKKVTISGYLKDAVSGESLAGALIIVQETGIKASANTYGFYSLSLSAGDYKLSYSYMGYQQDERSVSLMRDTTLSVSLSPASNMMDEVVVSSSSKNDNVSKPVSVAPLTMVKVKQLPAFLGEADLIRSFQLLPGVSIVGDGASGFNVRDGGVDQNLVLIDEAPLYFTSHLFNLFSVANPDAIKDAALYKTEMPARFGGRLSSVLDIRMKDGNNQDWNFAGGSALLQADLLLKAR